MTNEEAIATIEDLKKLFRDNTTLIALTLATTALKREEGCKNISDHQIAYFKCSVCQEWVEANTTMDEHCKEYDFNFCPSCGRRVEK